MYVVKNAYTLFSSAVEVPRLLPKEGGIGLEQRRSRFELFGNAHWRSYKYFSSLRVYLGFWSQGSGAGEILCGISLKWRQFFSCTNVLSKIS